MCDHSRSWYETKGYHDEYGQWVDESEWREENTFEDIDLHRYRCTQCNKVFYYSERARRHYEDGVGDLP